MTAAISAKDTPYLTYAGSGTAQLTAGQLDSTLWGGTGGNTLVGGPGKDMLILGSGFNSVVDNAGDNLIVDPACRSGISFTSSTNAYNTLKIVAAPTTTEISATTSGSNLLVQMSDSDGRRSYDQLPNISQLMIDGQQSPTITIGAINVEEVTVNLPASSEARAITLDTPSATDGVPVELVGRASKEIPDPNNTNQKITRYGIFVTDDHVGGTNASVFGLGAADRLTITQHGGTTNIGDLSGAAGTIIFDAPDRSSGYSERSSLTTPVRTGGSTISAIGYGPFGAYGFLVQAAGDPDVVFKGMTSTDSINLNISAAPFGAPNQVNIDASYGLTTALQVNALGTLATNNILLLALSDNGAVLIDGAGTTNTTVTIGAGTLAPIYGNVSVANAILTVDNSTSTAPGNFVMTDSSLTGWDTNLSFTPRLTFSGLSYVATIKLAAGDQFDVESTPLGLMEVDVKNRSGARDLASIAGVTPGAPNHLAFDGDFKLYLGGRLTSNGLVTPSYTQLANTNVGFNFTSAHYGEYSPTLVRFLSFAGHSYTIGGNGNLAVTDQTIGLSAMISDYRAQDGVLIDLPGGSVNADLTRTSAGTITLDGTARLLGASPSAQNNITVYTRAGIVLMEPTSDVDSVLRLFNTIYSLGNRPQDSLDVYDSAGNIAIANHPIPVAYAQFARAAGDPNTVQAGQTFDFAIIAQDAGGNPLTNYTNQVEWYAYNQTTGHYLSSNYEPFAVADQGQHVFHGIVLSEAGSYTLGFDDGSNASSYTLVVSAAGQGTVTPATNLPGDGNGDGRVDAADYVLSRKTDGAPIDDSIWRTHFGETAASPPTLPSLTVAAAANSPASATLNLAGAVLFAADLPSSEPTRRFPASDLARQAAFEQSACDPEVLLQLDVVNRVAAGHTPEGSPADQFVSAARRRAVKRMALDKSSMDAQPTDVVEGHSVRHTLPNNHFSARTSNPPRRAR